MDARSSLIVIDAELVGALAVPAGANQHFVAFAEIRASDRLIHLFDGDLVLPRSFDVQDHRVSKNQSIERDLIQGS